MDLPRRNILKIIEWKYPIVAAADKKLNYFVTDALENRLQSVLAVKGKSFVAVVSSGKGGGFIF